MFIGATQEHMLRAYDSRTGQELWKNRLPAGGQATPATYWSPKSKRQFVVIAAGGHGAMLSGSSDTLIAFALPKASKRSEEHTSELQSLMRISYAVFCLKKKTQQ